MYSAAPGRGVKLSTDELPGSGGPLRGERAESLGHLNVAIVQLVVLGHPVVLRLGFRVLLGRAGLLDDALQEVMEPILAALPDFADMDSVALQLDLAPVAAREAGQASA